MEGLINVKPYDSQYDPDIKHGMDSVYERCTGGIGEWEVYMRVIYILFNALIKCHIRAVSSA